MNEKFYDLSIKAQTVDQIIHNLVISTNIDNTGKIIFISKSDNSNDYKLKPCNLVLQLHNSTLCFVKDREMNLTEVDLSPVFAKLLKVKDGNLQLINSSGNVESEVLLGGVINGE